MEYEAVVVKLSSSEALRVHHELGGGNTRTGGRGRPYSETSRDHSGGNGKQGELAHLSSPMCNQRDQQYVMAIKKRSISGLEKSVPAGRSAIKKIEMRGYSP